MTSKDEKVNARLDKIEMRLDTIDRRLDNIDKTLTTIGYELKYNAVDTAHLQTSVYGGFAVIAVVVALVGFVITLAPMFRDMYKDKRARILTEEKVQEMIDTAVNKALAVKR